MTSTCKIDGCEKRVRSLGYCEGHYTRVRNNKELTSPLRESRFPRGSVKKWLQEHVSYAGDECLEFPFGKNPEGYGTIKVDGFASPHRWMCDRAHPDTKDNGPWALHSCGKGHLACVNPKHLYWGTAKDNQNDMVVHGTAPKLVESPKHILERVKHGDPFAWRKLTEDDVIQIRGEYVRGETGFRHLARKYQVHRTTIKSVLRFETWKDVQAQS
jgi:hypothetical protein